MFLSVQVNALLHPCTCHRWQHIILQYFPHTPLSFSPHTLLCLICTLESRRAWQSPAASSGIRASSSSHCVSHPLPPSFVGSS